MTLPKQPSVLEKTYPVRYFEIGAGGEVHPTLVFDLLQDIAGEHAQALGVGVEALRARKMTWMLSRCRVQLASRVTFGDVLRIRTWPSLHKGIFAYREFEIFSSAEDDRQVGQGTTAWLLIDLKSGRPQRTGEVFAPEVLTPARAIDDSLRALPTATSAVEGQGVGFRIRRSDLDVNRHVNHRVHIEWALESVPAEVAGQHRVVDLEANYLAESFAGEEVVAHCSRSGDDLTFSHRIERVADGIELARLRSRWQPR